MPLIELNTTPSDRQLRQFAGLVLPLFALIVATILGWRFSQGAIAAGLLGVTAALAAAGLFRPALIRPVYLGWMVASYPIGWVVGHLVLGAVFFLVLTPIGWGLRLMGRDPLERRFEETRPSYWEPRDSPGDTSRYFRQF